MITRPGLPPAGLKPKVRKGTTMKTKIKIVLETPDGEKTDTVTADARDIRNYEAEFQQSFLTTDLSMTQITQLAYVTMKRLGRFKGSYDVFDNQCTEAEGADDEEDAGRPTQKAPGGGSSRS